MFNGCPWHEWSKLSPRERAANVAHYRLHYLVSAHISEATDKS